MSKALINRAKLEERGWTRDDIEYHLGSPLKNRAAANGDEQFDRWLLTDVLAAESNRRFSDTLSMRLEAGAGRHKRKRRNTLFQENRKVYSVSFPEPQPEPLNGDGDAPPRRTIGEIEWEVKSITPIPRARQELRLLDIETRRVENVEVKEKHSVQVGDIFLMIPDEDQPYLIDPKAFWASISGCVPGELECHKVPFEYAWP